MQYSTESIYIISEHTKALITLNTSYYRTKILDVRNEFNLKHTPEQIIANSCIFYGATIKGRREAVKERFLIHSKIPILLDVNRGLYLFPTASTKSKNCIWLSYYHIQSYQEKNKECYIMFRDGTSILVQASWNTIDMQHKRTSQMIAQFNRPSLFRKNYQQELLTSVYKKNS